MSRVTVDLSDVALKLIDTHRFWQYRPAEKPPWQIRETKLTRAGALEELLVFARTKLLEDQASRRCLLVMDEALRAGAKYAAENPLPAPPIHLTQEEIEAEALVD